MKHILIILSTILLFSACSTKDPSATKNIKTKEIELSNMIQSISPLIKKNEANDIAIEAIEYSKTLAKRYDAVKPALFHNTLINLGLKQRGLCFHYTNDLLKYLEKKNYQSFKFTKIISSRGEYFEHTAFILTNDNVEFKDSIVFDAWRDSGELYFAKVKEDKRYKWEIK